ncbi:MAG: galactose-1-phosphate uridylyltransferase [Pseudomonadales bacterium]|jgi:UDPglucose--hexose-1-phosphate uridylyltransferase|nr:galactose-1-phosphate uridylyltransferase [Pseudomonadales bacterium]
MTWERRWHPLREEWVTITSHRNTRPWSGSDEIASAPSLDEHDSGCYLCPGNSRVSGEQNPSYDGIFVFNNDHPSYSVPAPEVQVPADNFFQVEPAGGLCRVICYSPNHNGSLARMTVAQTRQLIETWAIEIQTLIDNPEVSSVLIFENKGEVVGVSNNHPHGQIYAPGFVLDGIRREAEVFERSAEPLMTRMISAEESDGQRIVVSTQRVVAFVPFFARFPYEVYVVPRQQHQFIHELDDDARDDLASVLHEVLVRYDNLWQRDFPYMMLLHQSPCDKPDSYANYHMHIQIHPPMRQPGLQKYLASVETGGGHFLNDGCPEDKAAELRAVSAIHYTNTDA